MSDTMKTDINYLIKYLEFKNKVLMTSDGEILSPDDLKEYAEEDVLISLHG